MLRERVEASLVARQPSNVLPVPKVLGGGPGGRDARSYQMLENEGGKGSLVPRKIRDKTRFALVLPHR